LKPDKSRVQHKDYYANAGCQRFIHFKDVISGRFSYHFLSGAGKAIGEEMEKMMIYSRCQKNVPIAGRFFATTLMPPSFF
jgi:hypothetical protein